MKKVFLIICDGMADRPIVQLKDKTPLESAVKPNIDKITTRSVTGLMHPVDVGVRPGSDIAHLSLFGYPIDIYYPGRGPFEAAGYGLEIKIGDVALRGNFATVDKDLIVLDRRAGRIDDTRGLIAKLSEISVPGLKLFWAKGNSHRLALVLRGKNLSGQVTDTDPHETGIRVLKAKPQTGDKNAKRTAGIINFLSDSFHEKLKSQDKANFVLLRGAGMLPEIPTFESRYGLKAVCITGGGLYQGIGKILGMDVIKNRKFTGKPNSDISGKIKTGLAALKSYDFIFIHIKAADNLAEDGNFAGKKKFIEKIDRALHPLVNRDDILLILTSDHTTSSELKRHTADPVPILLAGKNLHVDQVNFFGEREVSRGRLGHIKGSHLMPLILDYVGLSKLKGA